MTLKSRTKTTLLGLVGILLPALILKNYHGPAENTVIILCIGVASLVGFYEGATLEEEEEEEQDAE